MGRFFRILQSVLQQIYLLIFSGINFVRHKIVVHLLGEFPDLYDAKVCERKRELFNKLKDFKSADDNLRKRNELRILEIGVGFGANLEYYPKKCHLITVDPSETFEQYFRSSLEKYPGITLEEYVIAVGENMKQIPSGSVDVVVTTLLTCCVKNIEQVFSEIQRVLAPGGKYIYMEHVIYERHGHFAKFILQKLLNLTRIWPYLFGGCTFQSRDRMSTKLSRYLTIEHQDKFDIDTSGLWIFKLLAPHVSGVASKS